MDERHVSHIKFQKHAILKPITMTFWKKSKVWAAHPQEMQGQAGRGKETGGMKTIAMACAIITIIVVTPAPAVLTQSPAPASIQAEMLKDWTSLKDTLMTIVDEMPAEYYDFKPTPPQETFGRRVVHIAVGGNRFLELMGGKAAAPKIDATAAAMSKAAAMKALADSFDYGTAILKGETDQTMLQTVDAPFLGPSSRARVFTFVMGHTWDLYGQLAIYLRLQGHVPPASQRP
jgi:uncharacterized damage-inducible protein DinB